MKRESFKNIKRLVVKVGTSTLSYPNGRLNFQRMEKIANVISELRNQSYQVVLVSSGAIGVGAGRIGYNQKPKELSKKQALAALGQAQLMKIYQKIFESYNQTVAQVLLTKDVMINPERHSNAKSTLFKLLDMDIIPIINENDTISTDEIEFGDNDTLSAMVANLVEADLLILMSDIDGLYSADPKTNPDAEIIPEVCEITAELENLASGTGNSFGTGGMITKILAAKFLMEQGIDTVITNGDTPGVIFEIIRGESVGTHFIAGKNQVKNAQN